MEYKRKSKMEKTFSIQNQRMADIVRKAESENGNSFPEHLESIENRFMILLAPLIELAWSDGKIGTREMEAIFKVAEAYGIDQNADAFARLVGMMTSRPTPSEIENHWRGFEDFWNFLPDNDREELAFCLLFQARFVAERNSNSTIELIRGERVGRDEREALQNIAARFKHFRAAARARKPGELTKNYSENRSTAAEFSVSENRALKAGIGTAELLPLVPLVKVAWAEGRITKRERQIIYDAAVRRGIQPESPHFQRLSDWLELHPTENFYQESLAALTRFWNHLPPEERELLHLDVLSDCTNIAEASGGTRKFPAGGPRVCDEEIAAVRSVAEKLNASKAAAVRRYASKIANSCTISANA